MIIVELSFCAGLFNSPFVVQLELIQFSLVKYLKRLLNIDDSFEQKTNIRLLLYLFSTFVYLLVELKARPVFSFRVEERNYTVKQVDRETEDIEFTALELFILFVFEQIAPYLVLICIFTQYCHPIEQYHHHTEQTTQVGKGNIKTSITAIVLLNQICLLEVYTDILITINNFHIANHWPLNKSKSS